MTNLLRSPSPAFKSGSWLTRALGAFTTPRTVCVRWLGLGLVALAAGTIAGQASAATGEPSGTLSLPATGNCANDFYVAEATLAPGAKAGFWGMEVKLSADPRELKGGFNLGGAFDGGARNPGFGAFSLSSPQRVGFTVYAQPLTSTPIGLVIDLMKDNTTRVAGTQGAPTAAAPLTFAADLQPGFYVVKIGSTTGSGKGTFQLALGTEKSFAGGVVVGGYLDRASNGTSLTGFGAFCVPQTQPVTVQLYGASQYGSNAAGNMVLTIKDNQNPRNTLGTYGGNPAPVDVALEKSNLFVGGTWSFTYNYGKTYVDTFKMTSVRVNTGSSAASMPYMVLGTNKWGDTIGAAWIYDIDAFMLVSELTSTSDDVFVYDFTSNNTIEGCYYFDFGQSGAYNYCTRLTGSRTGAGSKALPSEMQSDVAREKRFSAVNSAVGGTEEGVDHGVVGSARRDLLNAIRSQSE